MNRRIANAIRNLLDDGLPPVLRESLPVKWLVRLWLGSNSLVDFKYRAFKMTDREFSDAYRRLAGAYVSRTSDTTDEQMAWLLAQASGSKSVLEIGPGRRRLTGKLQAKGHQVFTLDLDSSGTEPGSVVATAERLPFAQKSVDVVILSHVIEHVRSLSVTFLELERVAREKVLIVTPKQRFSRVSFDYHLHFFYSLDHLASHFHSGTATGGVVDGDLCLAWRPDRAP